MKFHKLFCSVSISCYPKSNSGLSTLLGGLLFCNMAGAAGFGDIVLHSRIGERLLAEIPLIGIGKEQANPDCYTLATHSGSDLPVIAEARIRIIRNNDSYRLVLVGSKAIAEPAFTISLRANCEIDLRHDYILIPDAPAPQTEILDRVPPEQGPTAPATRDTHAAPGPKKQASNKTLAKSSRTERPAPPLLPEGSMHRESLRMANAPSGDHLVLSPAPVELKPGETPTPSENQELESRLLRMETSLHALNQEMDALNTSLTLSTEMLSAKRELQIAQSLQQPGITAVPPPSPTRSTSPGNWVELLASTALGGSLSVGIAAWLSRRKQADLELI